MFSSKPFFSAAILFATSAAASASTLVFPDVLMPRLTSNTPFVTTATSSLGPLDRRATLSFTLTTEYGTYISDLRVEVADPNGVQTFEPLPDAPLDAGDYSGPIEFFSTDPGSGTYALTFTNTFDTAFPVALSNIRLEVAPAGPVPEPASCAALALGALSIVRRRRR